MHRGDTPLVGRTAEMQALGDALERASSGVTATVVLEGDAGIGKTALIDAALARASDRGFAVRRAAGSEIDRHRPHGIVSEALGVDRDAEHADLSARIRRSAGDDAPGRAYAIVDEMLSLVTRSALDARIAIALDDLQWADPGTCLVVHDLARRLTDLPLLLILAARPDPRPPHLRAMLEALEEARATRLLIGDLDAGATRELVERIAGASPGASMDAHIAGAAGNPLFITELLAALERDGELDVASGRAEVRSSRVPPGLPLVILRRFSYLDPSALDVLRTAAVLGSTFTMHDLARVRGENVATLRDPVAVAMRAGVVVDDGERLRFRHDLLRESLYEDIPQPIRGALHAQAARSLEAAGAPLEQVAAHYRLGATRGDADAIAALHRAGRNAIGSAPATAVTLLTTASELAGPEGPSPELALDLATAQRFAGDKPGAAATLLGQLGDERAQARAMLEGLIERAGASDLERARAMAHLADLVTLDAQFGRAATLAIEALDLAEKINDDHAAAVACIAAANAIRWDARNDEAIAYARRAVEHAERAHDPVVRAMQPQIPLAMTLMGALRHDEVREVLDAAWRADAARQRVDQRPALMKIRAALDQAEGRWEDLRSDLDAAIDAAVEIGDAEAAAAARAQASTLAVAQGRTADARRYLDEIRAMPGATDADVATMYLVRWAEGAPADALQILRPHFEARAPGSYGGPYLADLVHLEMLVGDPARAQAIVTYLDDLLRTRDVPPLIDLRDRCAAIAARDPEPLLALVARSRGTPHATRFASLLLETGEVLIDAGRPGEAAPVLEEAADAFERMGAQWLLDRAEAALRRAGAPRGARGKRGRRPTTGWESLTRTERRVVGLVADGLTNAEIAGRLVISTRTVESHLSHVYTKLGFTSRLTLVREAAEHAG